MCSEIGRLLEYAPRPGFGSRDESNGEETDGIAYIIPSGAPDDYRMVCSATMNLANELPKTWQNMREHRFHQVFSDSTVPPT